jgi:hypothetical protein
MHKKVVAHSQKVRYNDRYIVNAKVNRSGLTGAVVITAESRCDRDRRFAERNEKHMGGITV